MSDGLILTRLVSRLLAGDREACEQFVDGAWASLIAFAVVRWRVSQQDAEELALDVIKATLDRLPTLRFDDQSGRDPLFSYMVTAIIHAIQERYREAKREQDALGRLANSRPSGSIGTLGSDDQSGGRVIWAGDTTPAGGPQGGDMRRVREFLATLSDEDRLIAQLRSHTTLMWEEIAEDIGINSAAIRKRWQRILERARRFWRNLEQESSVDVRS